MIKIVFGFLSFIFISCTTTDPHILEKKNEEFKNNSNTDISDQINYLGTWFLKEHSIPFNKLPTNLNNYLIKTYDKIQGNNSSFLRYEKPEFYLVKSDSPFHFSFPNAKIVFSTKLLSKYVRYEGDLVSIMAFEMVRSLKKIYLKKKFIPVKAPDIQQMLYLTNLSIKNKIKINHWIYFLLKKANYDPYIYLSWLQMKNKNASYFRVQDIEGHFLPLEEFQFKSIYIKNSGSTFLSKLEENKDPDFYKFIYYFQHKGQ